MKRHQPAAPVMLYLLRKGRVQAQTFEPDHAERLLALEAEMGLTAGWSRTPPENPHLPAEYKARLSALEAESDRLTDEERFAQGLTTFLDNTKIVRRSSPESSTPTSPSPGDSVPAPSARRTRKPRR